MNYFTRVSRNLVFFYKILIISLFLHRSCFQNDRINLTRSRCKFNFKFNLSPRNSREIGRPFFDRWIDRETGTFRRWCCSRNRWRFSLKSEPRRSTEKRKRGWSAFSSPRIIPRRARNLKNRAKSPGIGNGDRWRGKERETSWPLFPPPPFPLFSIPFFIVARSIVEPDPVPDRSLVTRLGKIGRRASRPLKEGLVTHVVDQWSKTRRLL